MMQAAATPFALTPPASAAAGWRWWQRADARSWWQRCQLLEGCQRQAEASAMPAYWLATNSSPCHYITSRNGSFRRERQLPAPKILIARLTNITID